MLAETLVAPARTGQLDVARAALEQLGVTELGFREDAPARLAELSAETSLKLPGCCVVLAAQDHEGAVASFDTDLVRVVRELGLETVFA